MDSRLLPMLANDPECVANTRTLCFSMVRIAPEDARYVARLANVKDIVFYDCTSADAVLEHACSLPIESLFFEGASVSPDSLRNLSNFPKLTNVHFEWELHPDDIVILKTLPSHITVEFPPPTENAPEGQPKAEKVD